MATGMAPEKLEGWSCTTVDEKTRCEALARALDYRGDVTLRLADGKEIIGYVFNTSAAAVQLLLPGKDDPVDVPVNDIHSILFTGRDAAAGKSWEAWLAKVAEAESCGQIAELYPDEAA
ncbi:hypothetical protein K2Y11_24195 [bacterium]|nr:hypothetical protein [bacterium]